MDATSADADDSADEMAMLGLMQQMTFNSAAIRFDDASLTSRAINLVARSKARSLPTSSIWPRPPCPSR